MGLGRGQKGKGNRLVPPSVSPCTVRQRHGFVTTRTVHRRARAVTAAVRARAHVFTPVPPIASPREGNMRDHVRHDRGVLAHGAAARGNARPGGPELRACGGAPPRPRRGGFPRRRPQPSLRRSTWATSWRAGRTRTGEPGVVFQGGPVSLDSALGVAVVPGGRPASGRRWAGAGCTARSGRWTWRRRRNCWPSPWVPCGSSPGTRAGAPVSWRTSLTEGAWYVVESEPGDVSRPVPERLWREAPPPAGRPGDGGDVSGRPSLNWISPAGA